MAMTTSRAVPVTTYSAVVRARTPCKAKTAATELFGEAGHDNLQGGNNNDVLRRSGWQ
jgi:hypothetical protein